MKTRISKFIKINLFGCLSDYGPALLVTALVRTRMPGGVGGRGAKPLPIPLGTIGNDHRQAIGLVPGTHQVIGGRLAGRVWRVWLIGTLLVKQSTFPQCAEYFIGRHVMKAESSLVDDLIPVIARGLEQYAGTDDVGTDEFGRPIDGAIDV